MWKTFIFCFKPRRGNWAESSYREIKFHNGGRQSTRFSRWLWTMAEICKLLPDWFMLHSRVNQHGDRVHRSDPGFLVAMWWRESDRTTDWKPRQRVSWCHVGSKLQSFWTLELQSRSCVVNCRHRGGLFTSKTTSYNISHFIYSFYGEFMWFHLGPILLTWISNHTSSKMWDEITIHSQISTVQPLKFGKG